MGTAGVSLAGMLGLLAFLLTKRKMQEKRQLAGMLGLLAFLLTKRKMLIGK